jgi:hypothetical protein
MMQNIDMSVFPSSQTKKVVAGMYASDNNVSPIKRWARRVAVLLTAAVLPGAIGQAQPTGVDVLKTPLGAEPIVIEVNSGNRLNEIVKPLKISLSDELRSKFGNDYPVIWEPLEKQSSLTADRLPPVTLGLDSDATAQVVIEFDRTPLIGDNEQNLRLKIKEPHKLRAGVYKGAIVSHMHTLQNSNVENPSWPVKLIVHGRNVNVEFSDVDPQARQPVLRVGRPASVTIRVQTVGCGLGEGMLELRMQQDPKKEAALSTVLRIPLPLPEPVDTYMDLPNLTTALCPAPFCEPAWHKEIIYTTQSSPNNVESRTYEVRVNLPQCFTTGALEAQVTWESQESSGTNGALQALSMRVPVLAGIRVSPQHAMTNESITISVVTDQNLGEEVPLAIADDEKQEVNLLTAKKVPPDVLALTNHAIVYRVKTVPRKLGRYTVKLANTMVPDPATAKDPALIAAWPSETVFHVPFEQKSTLRQPIIVFVDSQPFWWDFLGKRAGVESESETGFIMTASTERLQGMQASLRGIIRLQQGHPTLLSDATHWNREPQMSLPRAGDNGKLPQYDIADPNQNSGPGEEPSNPKALPQENHPMLKQWDVEQCKDNTLDFRVLVSVGPQEKNPKYNDKYKGRRARGVRQYELRMNVAALGSDGQPVYRVVDVPFLVDVTDEWSYYQPYLTWIAIIVGVIVFGVVTLWGLNRWVSPRETGSVQFDDGSQLDLFGVPPVSGDLFAEPAQELAALTPDASDSAAAVESASGANLVPSESAADSLGPSSFSGGQDDFSSLRPPD